MKRGFKTSEAQLTVATIVGQLLAAIFGELPTTWAAGGSTAVAIAYAVSRGFTKHGGAEEFGALTAEQPHSPPADAIAARRAQLQAELDALNSSP